MDAPRLAEWVKDARQRTFDLVSDLTDEQLIGPHLEIVNPLLWEIGHVAWFQERWALRHASGEPPMRRDADSLFDSIAIAHDARWDLPLPSRRETLRYLEDVRDRVVEKLLEGPVADDFRYFVLVSTFHEDMHAEAFSYTRQTLSYPAPRLSAGPELTEEAVGGTSASGGDVELPGGRFLLGAERREPFVFDNEKWAHPIEVAPFAISRTAVTQGELAAFVDDGGYRRRELWSEAGWAWRASAGAEQPVYWRREGGGRWSRRRFDSWTPLEDRLPAIHVNWFEADAYCRWAGRRLPAEAEWEMAAANGSASPERAAGSKRRFPWGDEPPSPRLANLDGRAMGCVSVDAFAAGDSACGSRQMIGNVWEWTASDFLPYPGFVPDPYKEYSEPWFGTHKVLRGGCWATRGRLLRNTWRNFYRPERRDVWAGFRTCAP